MGLPVNQKNAQLSSRDLRRPYGRQTEAGAELARTFAEPGGAVRGITPSLKQEENGPSREWGMVGVGNGRAASSKQAKTRLIRFAAIKSIKSDLICLDLVGFALTRPHRPGTFPRLRLAARHPNPAQAGLIYLDLVECAARTRRFRDVAERLLHGAGAQFAPGRPHRPKTFLHLQLGALHPDPAEIGLIYLDSLGLAPIRSQPPGTFPRSPDRARHQNPIEIGLIGLICLDLVEFAPHRPRPPRNSLPARLAAVRPNAVQIGLIGSIGLIWLNAPRGRAASGMSRNAPRESAHPEARMHSATAHVKARSAYCIEAGASTASGIAARRRNAYCMELELNSQAPELFLRVCPPSFRETPLCLRAFVRNPPVDPRCAMDPATEGDQASAVTLPRRLLALSPHLHDTPPSIPGCASLLPFCILHFSFLILPFDGLMSLSLSKRHRSPPPPFRSPLSLAPIHPFTLSSPFLLHQD